MTSLDVSFLFAAASSSLAEPHLNRAVLSVQGSPWLRKVGCVGHGVYMPAINFLSTTSILSIFIFQLYHNNTHHVRLGENEAR